MAQVVKHLPTKHKALSSNPVPPKEKSEQILQSIMEPVSTQEPPEMIGRI
jgi:hypothetical protein